jgi:hypothetical protein
MPKKKKIKKINAKDVFDRRVSPQLVGRNSDDTINIFSELSAENFFALAKKYKLKERQTSSLVGFKDEFFVEVLVNQIISENKLKERFYCKKVTANKQSGLKARTIILDDEEVILTLGGDCVIFSKIDHKPLMAIECKEYIDMIRLKELIGESRLLKDDISDSINLLSDIKFCVFSEVLELTDYWSHLLDVSDLKYQIDKIFVIREGKRKDKANKPLKQNLIQFKEFITNFLLTIK